jgi:type VI protein secretion system component Hcp
VGQDEHSEQSSEPQPVDLELGDDEAAAVTGGDKAAVVHVKIKDITVTKTIDVSTPTMGE